MCQDTSSSFTGSLGSGQSWSPAREEFIFPEFELAASSPWKNKWCEQGNSNLELIRFSSIWKLIKQVIQGQYTKYDDYDD